MKEGIGNRLNWWGKVGSVQGVEGQKGGLLNRKIRLV
jgi:hypothetical protein